MKITVLQCMWVMIYNNLLSHISSTSSSVSGLLAFALTPIHQTVVSSFLHQETMNSSKRSILEELDFDLLFCLQ